MEIKILVEIINKMEMPKEMQERIMQKCHQEMEEIQLSVEEVSDGLTVAVTMVNSKIAPYAFFETFGIESYEIVDKDGKVIVKGEATGMAAVTDGKVMVSIPLDNVPKGEYRLLVREMVGSSKADQPLVLSGNWECWFTK